MIENANEHIKSGGCEHIEFYVPVFPFLNEKKLVFAWDISKGVYCQKTYAEIEKMQSIGE